MTLRFLDAVRWFNFSLLVLAGAAAEAGEWQSLFNGKDLSGWEAINGPAAGWKVEDGVLVNDPNQGRAWLATDKEYGNFELELEYRVPPSGNSGVFLRAPRVGGNPSFDGMEIQVLDDDADIHKNIQPWQHNGSLYGVEAAKLGAAKKPDQWQKYDIECKGRQLKVTLNGQTILDTNLDEHPDALANNPGLKRNSGYIGLQNHGTRVEFRNLRVRALD